MAAVAAGAMRQLGLAAVRADGARRLFQGVVGTTTVTAGLGVASFRIRHGSLTFLSQSVTRRELISQFGQVLPARIELVLRALTRFEVSIDPAVRAQSGAVRPTKLPHRDVQL